MAPVHQLRTDMAKNDEYEREFAFQCLAHKLPACMPQFSFANSRYPEHKRRRHRADFCFPDYWLLVEIDGGIWMAGGGAHSHPIDIERNMRKRNDAHLWGYGVLCFTPGEVTNGTAIAFTQKVLFARGWRKAQGATQSRVAANV